MPRSAHEPSIRASVLDRLIDDDPASPGDAPMTRAQSVRALRAAVRRDLEWLFNARRTVPPLDASCPEVGKSGYQFGLPDLLGFSLTSASDRARLLRTLHTAIQLFEPRLASVSITPTEPADGAHAHALHFRIEAQLLMDPVPEPIRFDSVLELQNGRCQVQGDADAR